MGFWPFGRKGEGVEVATRIVSAAPRDGVVVRGKLTLHFASRESKATADVIADQLASLVEAIVREAPDKNHVVGHEAEVLGELEARLPSNMPSTRSIEIAALHAVGDFGPRPSGEWGGLSPSKPPSSAGRAMPSQPGGPGSSGRPSGGPRPSSSKPPPSQSGPPARPGSTDELDFSLDSIPLDTSRRPLGSGAIDSGLDLHPNSTRALGDDTPEAPPSSRGASAWPPKGPSEPPPDEDLIIDLDGGSDAPPRPSSGAPAATPRRDRAAEPRATPAAQPDEITTRPPPEDREPRSRRKLPSLDMDGRVPQPDTPPAPRPAPRDRGADLDDGRLAGSFEERSPQRPARPSPSLDERPSQRLASAGDPPAQRRPSFDERPSQRRPALDERPSQRLDRPAPRVDPRSDDPPPRFDPRSEDAPSQRVPRHDGPTQLRPSQRGLAAARDAAPVSSHGGARAAHGDSPQQRPRVPAPPPSRGARPSRPIPVDGGLPVGSPPELIGEAIAGRVRDAACRLHLAALRVHDTLAVRGVRLDACDDDTLTSFAPASDAPIGQYETRHAQEVARWKNTCGVDAVERIRAETAVCATFLAYATMLEADVPQNITIEVLQAACAAAFAHERSPLGGIGRYMAPAEPSLAEELAAQLARSLGAPLDVPSVGYALGPVMTSIEADLVKCARVVRDACGL